MRFTSNSTDSFTKPIDVFEEQVTFSSSQTSIKKVVSPYKYLKCFLSLWLGLVIGSLSLSLIDPHIVITNKILGFLNLVIFPIFTAKGFQEFMRYYGREYINISSNIFFWGAFWFALGFLLVRYFVSVIM